MDISRFMVSNTDKFDLSKIKTNYSGQLKSKEKAQEFLNGNIAQMAEQQDRLYAQDKYALLLIFQGMDTAGKDSAIKHVMTGLNPQATQVHSFKQPSGDEINHDYLWRISERLPERGHIGIFNRSHYEEVVIVKVHNMINDEKIFERYHQIRNFEKYLYENGIIPVKIFLHISKDEQKERLLARIEDQSKNWKISEADINEREYWDQYRQCYQEAIRETSTERAPWYVVPSDKKWFSRLVISEIIMQTLKSLKLKYPEASTNQLQMFEEYKKKLLSEP
ncbi:MAG: polyphosphate kinase 2 family protein [Ruminiclostridium sp.]